MSITSSDSQNDSFSDDDSECNHYSGRYAIIETEIILACVPVHTWDVWTETQAKIIRALNDNGNRETISPGIKPKFT